MVQKISSCTVGAVCRLSRAVCRQDGVNLSWTMQVKIYGMCVSCHVINDMWACTELHGRFMKQWWSDLVLCSFEQFRTDMHGKYEQHRIHDRDDAIRWKQKLHHLLIFNPKNMRWLGSCNTSVPWTQVVYILSRISLFLSLATYVCKARRSQSLQKLDSPVHVIAVRYKANTGKSYVALCQCNPFFQGKCVQPESATRETWPTHTNSISPISAGCRTYLISNAAWGRKTQTTWIIWPNSSGHQWWMVGMMPITHSYPEKCAILFNHLYAVVANNRWGWLEPSMAWCNAMHRAWCWLDSSSRLRYLCESGFLVTHRRFEPNSVIAQTSVLMSCNKMDKISGLTSTHSTCMQWYLTTTCSCLQGSPYHKFKSLGLACLKFTHCKDSGVYSNYV